MLEDWELEMVRAVIDSLEAEQSSTYDVAYNVIRPKSQPGAIRKYSRANKTLAAAYQRRSNLKRYGLTPESYAELVHSQDGSCAICRKTCPSGARLAVDHCHATGATRGLLCTNCNTGIGKFKDDIGLLESAIKYLLKHRAK